jgi:hypothetical protein
LKKCREFLTSGARHDEELQARLALLDLQRNLYMEQEILRSDIIVEDVVTQEDRVT